MTRSSKSFGCDIIHDYLHNNISSSVRRPLAAKDSVSRLRYQAVRLSQHETDVVVVIVLIALPFPASRRRAL